MLNEQIQNLGIQQPKLSDLYTDIELTDEEKAIAIEKALFEARYEKYAAIQREEYWKKVNAPIQVKRYTSDELYKHLEELDGFDIDENNKSILKLLCQYFADDKQFESQSDALDRKMSLNKGIMLFGGVGVGKTRLMTMFANNQKQSYQVVACQDVEISYASNGDDKHPDTGAPGLSRFYRLLPLNAKNRYGQQDLGIMFDDLGQENKLTKYYGTERNVMEEVLSQRYRHGLFETTHITTNLSRDQIEQLYGARVLDRVKEMFNVISFPKGAPSRRK